MSEIHIPSPNLHRPSASELRRLTPRDRDAILAAQAILAEPLYRGDPELTDFEAFGEVEEHADSTSPETR